MKNVVIGFISGIVGIMAYRIVTGAIEWNWHYLGYPLTVVLTVFATWLFIYYQMSKD